MRRLIIVLCLTLCPAAAWAEANVTGLDIESTEPEVRIVIALDQRDPLPAHRLMRDDRCLRLRFVDVLTDGIERTVEDETIRRVRVIHYRNRTVVRMDPRRGSAVDLLERAEVQPHPRGLVIVINRTDRESSRYRANRQPAEPEREEQDSAETESRRASADDAEESEDTETAAATPTADRDEPRASDRESSSTAAAAAPTKRARQTRTASRSSSDADSSSSGSPTGGTVRASIAVGVIVFLGGVAWYMRRRRGSGPAGKPAPSIDVVSAKRVGPRQSLLLVEVGGQTLLVGATEKGMSRLAMVSGPTNETEDDEDDDLALLPEEEYAPQLKSPAPALRERRRPDLSALDRELRRSTQPPPEEERSQLFDRELRGAVPPNKMGRPELTDLLVAARNANSQNQSIQATPRLKDTTDGPAPDAIEGLLRLRQMADDSPAMPHPAAINGMNGTNGTNGTKNGDMSLAALESLLVQRQAN